MPVRYGFVSAYPPTRARTASSTAELYAQLVAGRSLGSVVRLVDKPQTAASPEVVGELVSGRRGSAVSAAQLLADRDVVIVQHDFDSWGGRDGDEVLTLLEALTVPSVVVLHEAPSQVSTYRREVLCTLVERAGAVVVMSGAARDRLAAACSVDPGRIHVIPHGATGGAAARPERPGGRPTVLTWGLLGPGKGIEWGVEAMALLSDLDPAPRYVVAGRTRPKVFLQEGETYRRGLSARARQLGLSDVLVLDGEYRTSADLAALVRSADVVLLPYDSADQVTSGVLAEAVGAGVPVVATEFPHAAELLAGGAGIVVPHRDPAALAAALRRVLTEPELAAGMSRAATAAAADLLWPAVADRYRDLAASLIEARTSV